MLVSCDKPKALSSYFKFYMGETYYILTDNKKPTKYGRILKCTII